MSYTPTTWQTGDTITAAGLNKIEQGIADAGSGGTATIKISATGFASSTSHGFGYIVYAYKDSQDAWIVANDELYELPNLYLYGYAEPNIRLAVLPLPSDNDVGVFLVAQTGADPNLTGSISTTPATLHFSFGSIINGGAYRITGNGTAELISD